MDQNPIEMTRTSRLAVHAKACRSTAALGQGSMKYYLCKPNLLDEKRIELTAAEFNSICEAKRNLVHALEVESCFHVVVDNYLALDNGMLSLASRHALFSSGPETDALLGQIDMTRNLMNYLSSAKSYVDYLTRKAKALAGSQPAMSALVDPHTSSNLHYTLLELLRNYAQHEGVPVSGSTVSNKFEQGDLKGVTTCSVAPTFLARDIRIGRNKVDPAITKQIAAHESPIRGCHRAIRGQHR